MEPHKVIFYPLMTERSIYMIENENKLVFIVNLKADKNMISKSLKLLYNVEAEKINTTITRKGLKKAFIKLKPEHDASDIAIRLGIL